MSFRPPTLKDAAAIVQPHNERLMRQLRASLLLELIGDVAAKLEEKTISRAAAATELRRVAKDFETAEQGPA